MAIMQSAASSRFAKHDRRQYFRKGTDGVSTNGVTARFMIFGRGTFRALSLTYFYIPKSARAYLFPQSSNLSKFITSAAAPLVMMQPIVSLFAAKLSRRPPSQKDIKTTQRQKTNHRTHKITTRLTNNTETKHNIQHITIHE